MIGTLQSEVVMGPPLWKRGDGEGEEYGEFDSRKAVRKLLW